MSHRDEDLIDFGAMPDFYSKKCLFCNKNLLSQPSISIIFKQKQFSQNALIKGNKLKFSLAYTLESILNVLSASDILVSTSLDRKQNAFAYL